MVRPALLPAYGTGNFFGDILSAPQMGRDEIYRANMNGIGRQLGALANEIVSHLPSIMTEAEKQSAWRELAEKTRSLMLYYVGLYKKNPDAPLPTRDTMLSELSYGPNKVSSLALKSAIDSMREVRAETTLEVPRLARPRMLEEVPAREAETPAAPAAQAARPAIRAAPTIDELRGLGFGNVIDVNIGGKIFRFAAKDAGLDLGGTSPENLLQYAAANPGQVRIFEVNARGYATRELRATSERDMGRIRSQIEAQQQEQG